MKIINFEMIGSCTRSLLLCLISTFLLCNSTAIAADYDNFNGSEVDSTLWAIYGDGNESENASAYTLSGGLLLIDVPASLRFTALTSTRHFSGDVEFSFDFRDFHSGATTFTGGPPSISLSLKWEDQCISMTIYHQDNLNYLGSARCNDPNGFTTTITASSGVLTISRIGTTVTSFYDTGTGPIHFGSFSDVDTGDVSIGIEFQTGDNGSMQVSSDYLIYEDQIFTPIDPDSHPEPEPDIILSPPENLTALVDGSDVNFTWSEVSDSDGYRLYYGISPGSYIDFVELNAVTSLAATDVPAGNYYLAIRAYRDSSESDFSNEVNVFVEQVIIPEPEPEPEPDISLSPPENLSSLVDGSDVSIAWSEVSAAAGYRLYFGFSSGNYVDFVELNSVTSLAASGVAAGNYYVAVTAYSGNLESDLSNEVNLLIEEVVPVEIVIPPAENFVASVDENSLTLSWTPVASATGYELYYGVSSNEYVGSVVLDNASLVVIPDVPNGTYFLALVTHSGDKESSFSNELSVIVNAFDYDFSSSSKSVGPSGGILEFTDGIVFDVPAGAVDQEVTLTVRKLDVAEVDPIFASRAYASNEKTAIAAFSAEPSGLVFNLPVTVSLPVPPLEINTALVHAELQLGNADYWLSYTDITYIPDEGLVEMQIQSLSGHAAAGMKNEPGGFQALDGFGTIAADAICRTGVVRSKSTFLDFSRSDQCLILSATLATTFLSCPGSPTERHLITEISRACGPNFRLNLSDIRPGEITVGDPPTKLRATVEAQFSDGSTRPFGETLALSWESLNPDILEVDIIGNAIGRVPGTATVRVRASERFYAERQIVVNAAEQDPPSGGELSVELTSASCAITQVATYSYRFALEASGTASGSVDTRFEFNWSVNPGININSCGVWTFRESQQDCIRGPNDPPATTWTGGDAVNLPLAAVTFNEPRQITPFVNAGGSLGSTHPANFELDPFTIACQ